MEDRIWISCNLHSCDSYRFGRVLGAGEIQEGRCDSFFLDAIRFFVHVSAPFLGP